MKKGRDVKFVIYQVLYIFVVCVIALKHADINLEEVIDSKTVVQKSFADSLKAYIDSLLALGLVPEIKFDTNNKFSEADMEKLLAQINQLQKDKPPPMQLIEPQKQMQVTERITKENIPPPDKEKKIEAKIQGIELTQYHQSTIKNPYNGTLLIIADGKTYATIPQGGSATFVLAGESSVTFKVEGVGSDTKSTKPNQTPKVTMQRQIGGADATVQQLQSRVAYRVTIIDDYPGDLEVGFSGPIKKTQVSSNAWDISMNQFGSEAAFDGWAKGKDGPYRVTFTVTVKEKYNKNDKPQQVVGIFEFGKYK